MAPGDSVPYYYTDPVYRESYPDSVKFDPYYNYPASGFSTWKYFTDPCFTINRASLGDYPQNTKYFRFSDLLLTGAEAAVNCGHEYDALQWVNRVRDRARNAGNTGYSMPLATVSKEQIWAERRVELCFEGHQFYDIVRTQRAGTVLKSEAMEYENFIIPDDGNEIGGLSIKEHWGDYFDIGKDEIWPYPPSEIDFSNVNF
jgi:hypothetical protein